MPSKNNIRKIKKIFTKKNKKPITCLTSYTKSFTEIIDKYCDVILVGDSVGTVLYGMNSTKEVNMDIMINHAKSVKSAAVKSLVVVDMPVNSYRNKSQALKNAQKLIKQTKCDAVKLEGGAKVAPIIKFLSQKNISVIGHIGYLPQFSKKKNKLRGKHKHEKISLLKDSIALDKAGAVAIVIECVVEKLAKDITKSISIPTIGIGASKHCDGQILVTDDMLGLSNFYPKFVKRYENLRKYINRSVKKYCFDVKKRKFPSNKYTYRG